MNGTAAPLVAGPADAFAGLRGGHQLSASLVNSFRVAAVAERLALHVHPGQNADPVEFFNLCLSLARGIDFAVANNEVPGKAQDLPSLLKQICQRKNDVFLQAGIMVLMISVKNACKIGWFSAKESEDLFNLANEIGSSFSTLADINLGPSSPVSIVSTVMSRFFPLMKMGKILASLEVKPGYGAFVIDFHISKNTTSSPHEKIRLFVAQTDNLETSACIISPQQVNFLLNGRGVDRRTNVLMEPGPQLPTNVTAMLKYGTNLLQAVGQFNGPYIIVVAFVSTTSSLDSSNLDDYVHSGITVQESDSDIIEGPSRISLNCPISYTRIKTPVKGHSCKHLQCFDFNNYISINSRRPYWRCPHCNQCVCYTDIRVDQNMVKVLREVGKNVADVIISEDGSWKAVLESDDDMDQAHNKTLDCEKEGSEQETTGVPNSNPDVCDLTKDDDKMDCVAAGEIEDRKPLLTDLQSESAAVNITNPSELNNTVGVNQTQTGPEFLSRLFFSTESTSSITRSDAVIVSDISTSANIMTSPVLTDAISPALDREPEGRGYANSMTSVMQSQYSAPTNLHSQPSQHVNAAVNAEYGTLTVPRVSRNPIAIQALPAPSQTPSTQHRSGPNFNSLTSNGSSLASQAGLSMSNGYILNSYWRQDMAPSALQHQSAARVGLPASSTLPGHYRVSSGHSTENQNLHQQQAPNPRMPQSRSHPSSIMQSSSPLSRTLTQQGGTQIGIGHTAGNGSSQHSREMEATNRAVRVATQLSRQHTSSIPVQPQGGHMQAARAENSVNLPPEQDWRPTGRMRGSLSGRAYSDALNQFMNQQTLPARPQQPNLSTPRSNVSIPPHLQALLGNSRSPHLSQPQNNPTTEPGSGILPERSQGMH